MSEYDIKNLFMMQKARGASAPLELNMWTAQVCCFSMQIDSEY